MDNNEFENGSIGSALGNGDTDTENTNMDNIAQESTEQADGSYRYGREYSQNMSYSYGAENASTTEENTSNENQWQPETGAMYAEKNGKKKKARKKKEKKPLTMGRVVRTCVGFMLITVVVNSAVMYGAMKANLGGYVTSSEYKKSTSLLSTQSNINSILSSNSSDVTTTDNSNSSSLSVKDVATAVLPSVVSITSTSIYQSSSNPFMYGGTYQVSGAGSGIIIGSNDSELLIVTNNHVVEDTTSLTIEFVDGTTIDSAYVKGTNSSNDIAVVAVKLADVSEDTASAIRIATLGDSDSLNVGDQVVAIGNALGYGQSVTVGYVSALNRTLTVDNNDMNTIQTDASINGGNSGGALINMNGEVVGINFAKQSSSSSSSSSIEGMGYAIPISQAKDIINELMNKEVKEKVEDDEKGYIGITSAVSIDSSVTQMYNIPEGAYLKGIAEGSPADEAGIQIGDVIVAVDGDSISSYEDLQEMMGYYAAGDKVKITVERANGNSYKEKEIEVTLCSYDELETLIGK
jgi:serine protease Do